jgi:hypothetical protein
VKLIVFTALITGIGVVCSASAFEGRITVSTTRGGDAENLLYTVGTNFLRIERLETNRPYARDVFDLGSGQITLVYPHNRSFVRFSLASENVGAPPGFPQMPPPPPMGMPSGPEPANPARMPTPPPIPPIPNMPAPPPGIGPQSGPNSPGMARPPMIPPMPMEQVELKATGDTTNLLGYPCERYEIQQRGETMEIWATSKLLPFQPYMQNQPPRFGPRMIEEQWGGMLRNKKLFPLLAILKYQNGTERQRFEVTAIEPGKIEDKDGSLSQPPPDYNEVQPLPF